MAFELCDRLFGAGLVGRCGQPAPPDYPDHAGFAYQQEANKKN